MAYTILFVSALKPKVVGNQSLINALLGHARAGHEVHFLTLQEMQDDDNPERYEHLQARAGERLRVHVDRLFPPLLRRGVDAYRRAMRRRAADAKPAPAKRLGEKPAGYDAAAPGSTRDTLVDQAVYALFTLRVFPRVVRLARAHKADVIVGYEAHAMPAAWLAARLLGVPFVSRAQGTFLAPMLGRPRKLLRYFHHTLSLALPADLAIMTNDGTRGDEVYRAFGQRPERIRFWMNGIEKEKVLAAASDLDVRAAYGIPRGRVLLLCVSKLVRWKGVERNVRIVHALAEMGRDAHLVVVGDGPDRPRLEAIAKELGVSDRVTFTGRILHGHVGAFYAASDVFLSFYDLSNLGNPLLEALLHGLLVATPDDGSTRHILSDGKNALFLPADDLAAAAARLHDALSRPEEVKALREGARATGAALWTWEERMRVEVEETERLVAQARERKR